MVDSAFPLPPGSRDGISAVGFYAALFLQAHIAKEGMEGDFEKLSERAVGIANTFMDVLRKEERH